MFDSNRGDNPMVALAEARFVIALEKAGAVVRIARLPVIPGAGHVGPDDYLVHRGEDAVKKLIEESIPGDPVEYVQELTCRRNS
jgi:hypothetical protein